MTNPLRIFISGPYTAGAHSVTANVARAKVIAEHVIRLGLDADCPHTHGSAYEHITADWGYWMRVCIRRLSTCDALVTVPGWQDSRGSCVEIAHALTIRLPIFHATDDLDLPAEFLDWAGAR